MTKITERRVATCSSCCKNVWASSSERSVQYWCLTHSCGSHWPARSFPRTLRRLPNSLLDIWLLSFQFSWLLLLCHDASGCSVLRFHLSIWDALLLELLWTWPAHYHSAVTYLVWKLSIFWTFHVYFSLASETKQEVKYSSENIKLKLLIEILVFLKPLALGEGNWSGGVALWQGFVIWLLALSEYFSRGMPGTKRVNPLASHKMGF